jgi:SAM-dependent methyltransferase
MFRIIAEQTKKLAQNPKRLREVLRPRRWRQFFSVLFFSARSGDRWKTSDTGQAFKQREYSSYDEYVAHQGSKLKFLDLADYDRIYGGALRERLQKLSLKPGAKVLCLGARQGTEVKAFRDLGCDTIGIDLTPGENNPYVVKGDFHDLQFAAQSMDVMFTNSLDHAFDPKKMLAEIRRVLKPGGRLIVEAMRGEAEAKGPDAYASFWWRRVDDLVSLLAGEDFEVVQRAAFTEPWDGEQICFRKKLP